MSLQTPFSLLNTMPAITVTLNDTLQDCVDSAIEQTEQALQTYLEDNHLDETPCLSNDLDYDGTIHEIIDGAVPICTNEIETAWFLHGNELEQAYENAGVGGDSRDNNGMAAIYYYISDALGEWYSDNAEGVFEGWLEAQESEEEEK